VTEPIEKCLIDFLELVEGEKESCTTGNALSL